MILQMLVTMLIIVAALIVAGLLFTVFSSLRDRYLHAAAVCAVNKKEFPLRQLGLALLILAAGLLVILFGMSYVNALVEYYKPLMVGVLVFFIVTGYMIVQLWSWGMKPSWKEVQDYFALSWKIFRRFFPFY